MAFLSLKAEIHLFKAMNRAKIKKILPKSIDWTADFSGSKPKTLTFHEANDLQLALLFRQQWQDDNSIIGFDTSTIEVFNSVVMSVCSLKTHVKGWNTNLAPIVLNQSLSKSDLRDHTFITTYLFFSFQFKA